MLDRALQEVRAAKDERAGPVRIVGPRLTFLPVIRPDVQPEDRIGNWVQDRVDVGFRIGSQAEDGVVARRLYPLQLVICATPDYLARYGAPDSLASLTNQRCSAFRHPVTGQLIPWSVKVDGDIIAHAVSPALSTNDAELEVESVLSSQMIGQLVGSSAAAHIRSGRLIPLQTQHVADNKSIFIYYGSRTAQPTRVRAFIDLAIERLAERPCVSAESRFAADR